MKNHASPRGLLTLDTFFGAAREYVETPGPTPARNERIFTILLRRPSHRVHIPGKYSFYWYRVDTHKSYSNLF